MTSNPDTTTIRDNVISPNVSVRAGSVWIKYDANKPHVKECPLCKMGIPLKKETR
jgi:hypothetical protein